MKVKMKHALAAIWAVVHHNTVAVFESEIASDLSMRTSQVSYSCLPNVPRQIAMKLVT